MFNGLSEHIAISGPASTVTPGLIVNTISSETASHAPTGSSVVSVNVTEPAAISPAVGVYTAFMSWSSGTYVPDPPDHCAELAPPPNVPFKVKSSTSQMTSSTPALTVGAFFTVIANVSGVPVQPVASTTGVTVILDTSSAMPNSKF